MKPGSNSKRSRGRNNPRRPNGGGGHGGGGQHGHGGPRTQVFESNGPEVRIRGTVNQVLEKYLALARDASSSGDYVSAENYFQHAEHYFRILSANGGAHAGLQQRLPPGQGQGPQPQPQQQQQPRGPGEQRGPEGAPSQAAAQTPAGGNGSVTAPERAPEEGEIDAP
jgi:hypothetical protein